MSAEFTGKVFISHAIRTLTFWLRAGMNVAAQAHSGAAAEDAQPSSRDLVAEYARLGVGGPSSEWKLDETSNASFDLCTTYSRSLAVPVAATSEHMAEVARYRSRGRMPVLCWRRINGSTGTLIRCAQPSQGLLLKTSAADEEWIKLMWRTSGARSLVLFDSRSMLAAYANRFRGGGVEAIRRYGIPRVNYCSIRNIHVVKKLAQELRTSQFARAGASHELRTPRSISEWLDVQARLLDASLKMADYLEGGCCVVLHCSDGWDRTSQMSSLAQLMLDAHYRTCHGFATLVEKEWSAFGHRFWMRRYLGQPIFAQFLDAVVQLLRQHPTAFGFNERFLSDLLAMHDGRSLPEADSLGREAPPQFAPFDCDSDRERLRSADARAVAAAAPPTVWDQLLAPERAHLYRNPEHVLPAADALMLRPDCRASKLRVWEAMLVPTLRDLAHKGRPSPTAALVPCCTGGTAHRPLELEKAETQSDQAKAPKSKAPLEVEMT